MLQAKIYWSDFKKVIKDDLGKLEWDSRAKRYLGELNGEHGEYRKRDWLVGIQK